MRAHSLILWAPQKTPIHSESEPAAWHRGISAAWKALLLRCSWHRRAHVLIGVLRPTCAWFTAPLRYSVSGLFSRTAGDWGVVDWDCRVGRFIINIWWEFSGSQAGVKVCFTPFPLRGHVFARDDYRDQLPAFGPVGTYSLFQSVPSVTVSDSTERIAYEHLTIHWRSVPALRCTTHAQGWGGAPQLRRRRWAAPLPSRFLPCPAAMKARIKPTAMGTFTPVSSSSIVLHPLSL